MRLLHRVMKMAQILGKPLHETQTDFTLCSPLDFLPTFISYTGLDIASPRIGLKLLP